MPGRIGVHRQVNDVLVLVDEGSVELEDQVIDIAFEINLAQDVYISPPGYRPRHPRGSRVTGHPLTSSSYKAGDSSVKAEFEALRRHRLSRARETLAEGQYPVVKQAAIGTVNRFYYAVFCSAPGLLATKVSDLLLP